MLIFFQCGGSSPTLTRSGSRSTDPVLDLNPTKICLFNFEKTKFVCHFLICFKHFKWHSKCKIKNNFSNTVFWVVLYKKKNKFTGACLWSKDPDPDPGFFYQNRWPRKTRFATLFFFILSSKQIKEGLWFFWFMQPCRILLASLNGHWMNNFCVKNKYISYSGTLNFHVLNTVFSLTVGHFFCFIKIWRFILINKSLFFQTIIKNNANLGYKLTFSNHV